MEIGVWDQGLTSSKIEFYIEWNQWTDNKKIVSHKLLAFRNEEDKISQKHKQKIKINKEE